MDTITEPAQDIEIIANTDVCVVGGGTAGIAAALGAARTGARTVLVEAHGSLGGQMSLGYVNMIPPWDYEPGAMTFGGVMTEMVHRLQEEDAYWRDPNSSTSFYRYDVETCKALAVSLLNDANVNMRLHSWVSNAIIEERRIRAVVVDGVDGRKAIGAGSFVDASGDAILAHVAGADYEVENMGISLCAVGYIPDVETAAESVKKIDGGLAGYLKENGFADVHIAFYPSSHWHWNNRAPGLCDMSFTVGKMDERVGAPDGLDVDAISRIENDGRLRMNSAVQSLRKEVPGFEDMILVNSSDHLGVRWTRLVTGDYRLSKNDVERSVSFEDAVAVWGKTDAPAEIPYRSVYSASLDNLWVGGRCISAEQDNYAPRIIPCCVASGQAAGVAAGLAARNADAAQNLDMENLVEALIRQGVALRGNPSRLPQ
jgi:hypothetical protein